MPTIFFIDPLVKHINHDDYEFVREARHDIHKAINKAIAQRSNIMAININSITPMDGQYFTLMVEISAAGFEEMWWYLDDMVKHYVTKQKWEIKAKYFKARRSQSTLNLNNFGTAEKKAKFQKM